MDCDGWIGGWVRVGRWDGLNEGWGGMWDVGYKFIIFGVMCCSALCFVVFGS